MIVFTSDNGSTHPGRDPAFHIGGADPPFFNSTSGLRGWKGSVYEGGIRIPCVVKWPGKVAPGSTNALPTYFPDWFPTLANAAKAKLPDDLQLDGNDMENDLSESEDVAKNHPDIVAKLENAYLKTRTPEPDFPLPLYDNPS
jgi:arylsulfatase